MSSITGTDNIFRNLRELPERVRVNIGVGATRKVANAIVKEAKANAPVDTGSLKLSIAAVKRRDRTGNTKYSVVPKNSKNVRVNGVKGKVTGWYAHFVEFGTVNTPAHPFLRPAYENIGPNAIEIFTEYANKRFDKEMRRLNR